MEAPVQREKTAILIEKVDDAVGVVLARSRENGQVKPSGHDGEKFLDVRTGICADVEGATGGAVVAAEVVRRDFGVGVGLGFSVDGVIGVKRRRLLREESGVNQRFVEIED